MKLVWCPDTATKAYIDTVKYCKVFEESSVAELVSALAGGWKPQLIVEAWYQGGLVKTSVGLALASRHTSGRHVCVVPDEEARTDYTDAVREACGIAPEVLVGDAEEVMGRLVGIDFLVVDSRRKDLGRVLKTAELSLRGAVLVCKNTSQRRHPSSRWRGVVENGGRILRSAILPVGKGLEIAYVGSGRTLCPGRSRSRWVRHTDESSGEEYVYRR